MPLVVKRTARCVGPYHLTSRLVMQEHAGFNAAKGMFDFIDHTVHQLIQVENGCDFLRRLLYTLQPVDQIVRSRSDGG